MSWPEQFPTKDKAPGFSETLVVIGIVCTLAFAEWVSRVPDASGQCTDDTDCMHQCIRMGGTQAECVNAGYDWPANVPARQRCI